MTIYIVTAGEYSYYHIEAVFTDKEQARLYCATHNKGYDLYEIEEWEADEVQTDTDRKVMEKVVGWFTVDGVFIQIIRKGLALEAPMECKMCHRLAFGMSYKLIAYLPEGTNDEKAKKIMCDFFAKWKYEQSEVAT